MFLKRGLISLVLFLVLLLTVFLLTVITSILAHENANDYEDAIHYEESHPLFQKIRIVIGYASAAFLALIFLAVLLKSRMNEVHKRVIFVLIALLIVSVTAYIVIGSVYVNVVSQTRGPVHWHADYEVWICEQEMNIIDPKLPLNRVGTHTLHDHGDNRIHIEGIVHDYEDVSLGAFFFAIGGRLAENDILIPTNEGVIHKRNGDLCDSQEGKLYVFINGELIEKHAAYVIAPYETIPPGDTIKVVFSSLPFEEISPYIKSYGRERRI